MGSDPILNALKARPGTFVSGEELSQLLGVSRTAIWKDIQQLREEGYKILSQPHVGYRLIAAPDRMIPQELQWHLQTQRVGRRIHAYETTDSTMEIAHRLAGAGTPDGTVIVSEGQTRGRGRLGRGWVSPKGKGIYLSVILRPSLQIEEISFVTLMAAVAAAKAIQAEIGMKPQIKWPNDLLLNGKKVCGILTELNAEVNRVHYVVLGIGINVNGPPTLLPPNATSLSEEVGEKVDRVALTKALFTHLDQLYAQLARDRFPAILEAWRGYADFLGRRIQVDMEGRTVEGQAVDLDENGALLVRTDTGLVESLSAGDLLVVR